MKTPLQELWNDVNSTKAPAPAPRPRVVADRVNQILDAASSERKCYMKQKYKAAIFLAAAVTLLTGTAFAVAKNWTVLDAFFDGDSKPGETLMDDMPHTVSDGNYTFTVSSSVAAGDTVYLLLTVEAETPEAAEAMYGEGFIHMDTFSVMTTEEEIARGNWPSGVGISEEKSLGTETSRTFGMEVHLRQQLPETLIIKLGEMEKSLTVPVTPAEGCTVSIDATGNGAGTLFNADGGQVMLDDVIITPLGIDLNFTCLEGQESRPVLAFLTEDGKIQSWSQMIDDLTERGTAMGEGVCYSYAFRAVQDLSQLEAVIFDGVAYPMDGETPYTMDVSSVLQPFRLPLAERFEEGSAFGVPVQALCDALGASYHWNEEEHSATMTFRETTIVLTEGSRTALVNDEAVEMPTPPVVRDGILEADCGVFCDSWLLSMYAAFQGEQAVEREERGAWVILP